MNQWSFSGAILRGLLVLALAVPGPMVFSAESQEQDSSSKEFIMSCTYGVMAGTLVGAASLAFTEQPGENLGRVARGASIGLYIGILLGLYVVYVVPGQLEKERKRMEEESLQTPNSGSINVIPLLNEKGLEGAYVNWTAMRF